MGDGAVELRVHVVVRIEQVQLDATHVDTPYVGMYIVVHVGNVNDHGSAVLVHLLLDGQAAEVLSLVVGNLLTIHGEGLGEVAITIEETYGTHIHVGVRSLLDVVSGQNTETTGVDLEHLVQTVLHAEVSHTGTLLVGLHVHVGTELLIDAVHLGQESLVLGHLLHLVVVDTLKQENGVLLYFLEEFLVKVAEQAAAVMVPGPPHVVCQLFQLVQCLRNVALHRDGAKIHLIAVACFDFHKN